MTVLSPAQQAIVLAPIGQSMQVLASAGSGKTRVLTERVRHLLENTTKDGVIALTFTNKSAEEMLARLESFEKVDERTWIATIHAVAQRIVDQYGHVIGLPSDLHIFERDLDRKTVFIQSLRDSGIDIDQFLNVSDNKIKRDRERIVQNYMDQFSIVKRELLSEDEIKLKYDADKNFYRIFQAYQAALLESGGIDFDDILVYAHKIILEQPWCGQIYRAKYKHICVDEAQDLNRAQYEFIKALCGDTIKSLMMVGDPNQMIYGFNGSSHIYLCQFFVNDFSPTQYILTENYRSSKYVVQAANDIRPGSQSASDYAMDGLVEIIELQDEKNEALWVLNKIDALLSLGQHKEIEGDIALKNMVVLARNRFVFKELERCLAEHDVPYSLKKGERLLEPTSVFGNVLDLAIRLRLNPRDWVDGERLCSILKITPPQNWGRDDLLQIFSEQIAVSGTPLSDLQCKILSLINQIEISKPNIPKLCEILHRSLIEFSSMQPTVQEEELERSIQELQEFRGYWTNFKRKGLGDSLSSFRNSMALGQLTDSYDPLGLTLSTVHTMKGLEKDIVFLIGMCEGLFPDYRACGDKELEEEKNNFFVAVTRSRRWLYISHPKYREMPWGETREQKPSRFINDILAGSR